jgi:hypothetical protein
MRKRAAIHVHVARGPDNVKYLTDQYWSAVLPVRKPGRLHAGDFMSVTLGSPIALLSGIRGLREGQFMEWSP